MLEGDPTLVFCITYLFSKEEAMHPMLEEILFQDYVRVLLSFLGNLCKWTARGLKEISRVVRNALSVTANS